MIWAFFGALLGGLNGVPFSLYIASFFVIMTAVLGDKLLLFILTAREIQAKDLSLDTLISSFGCTHRLNALRVYSFHSEEISLCLVNSIVTSDRSLIISDTLLKHERVMEILDEGLSGAELKKNIIKDLAIVLCYQILFLGYFFGKFSVTLKDIYFYSFRPITIMKNFLINREVVTPLASSLMLTNKKRAYVNRAHIINDIVKDYGIIGSDNCTLWSFLTTK